MFGGAPFGVDAFGGEWLVVNTGTGTASAEATSASTATETLNAAITATAEATSASVAVESLIASITATAEATLAIRSDIWVGAAVVPFSVADASNLFHKTAWGAPPIPVAAWGPTVETMQERRKAKAAASLATDAWMVAALALWNQMDDDEEDDT